MSDRFFGKLKKILKKIVTTRPYLLGILVAVPAVLLIIRLVDIQLVRGNTYTENYASMTKKEVSIPAMRGNIYDRNGELLASNQEVYSIVLSDDNYYTKSDGSFNEMLLRLWELLDRYGVRRTSSIPVVVGADGNYEFSGSESKVRLFIRNVYGNKEIQEQAEKGVDVYAYDAEKVMSKLKSLYNFTSRWARATEISKKDALRICDLRYLIGQTAYTKYISSVVARNISEEIRAAVMEHRNELLGVSVETTYERIYYDSECFSCILGYVGSITTEEIEELNAAGGDYGPDDMIGKQGVESAYESYLQGKKGRKQIYVNNVGAIKYEEILEEPVQGNDVYLSVDKKATVAAYHVMEQQLAGILISHLYEGTDYDPEEAYENNDYKTPVRDVYFQMINNNILSIRRFAEAGASETEKSMDERRKELKKTVTARLKTYLESREEGPLLELTSYMRSYVRYFETYLISEGYLEKDKIDTKDEGYLAWNAGEISFSAYLMHALRLGWVDMKKIGGEDRYDTVDACYEYLTAILIESLETEFGAFDKLIYDELIHEDRITGNEIGIALYEQGILDPEPELLQKLKTAPASFAFDFFKEKIRLMQITPAEIALDPCSAGLVLTDPNTGRLLAAVSYPGYDLNRISDSEYYASLNTNLSSPLYSRATQTALAPGSTFKMVTAIGALEGGYIRFDELIHCSGTFDKLDHPRCWIGRLLNSEHGDMNVVTALGQSCNCFFYECGYRFSLNQNGLYSPSTGIATLTKYAKMLGFGEKTGIETEENVSRLSTELPVTSAIGQGTHALTTISLARYLTAIASSGNVYEFKLLEHIENQAGEPVLTYVPQIVSHLEFKDSTWDLIHRGMYRVVHEGGSRNGDFNMLRYQYAAKSGSAQENRLRPEHGLYVTYGPYDDAKWAIAVQVPNGYSATNAAHIARGVYEYLEGDISLAEIVKNTAATGDVTYIGD